VYLFFLPILLRQLGHPFPYFYKGSNVDDQTKNKAIIDELIKSYFMELETVVNYLANSVNLDGVRAEEIKKSLNADVTEELTHATQLANRIKTIDGVIPGSSKFVPVQTSLQPPADTTDVVAVIKGVIDAEEAAITQYEKIIRLCDGFDFVTQDLCITLLADEQQHRREFVGFLKEYEKS
jgi:bacterioferritin